MMFLPKAFQILQNLWGINPVIVMFNWLYLLSTKNNALIYCILLGHKIMRSFRCASSLHTTCIQVPAMQRYCPVYGVHICAKSILNFSCLSVHHRGRLAEQQARHQHAHMPHLTLQQARSKHTHTHTPQDGLAQLHHRCQSCSLFKIAVN